MKKPLVHLPFLQTLNPLPSYAYWRAATGTWHDRQVVGSERVELGGWKASFPESAPPATIEKDVTRRTLTEEIERLRSAIRNHRDQQGDDRCFMDDEALYEVLPEGLGGQYDRRVGDQAAMLQNCARFIACRTEGGYWPTYRTLHDTLTRLVLSGDRRTRRIARAALTGEAEV